MSQTDDSSLAKFIRKEIHKHRRSLSLLKLELPLAVFRPTEADKVVNHGRQVVSLQSHQDILAEVLNHLRDDSKTLASCCLVCRAWYTAGSQVLFQTVRIRRAPNGTSSNLLHSFCKLMDSPRVTTAIRVLSFEAHPWEDTSGSFTLGLLQHVLTLLPNLHTLRIVTLPGTVSKAPETIEITPLLRLRNLELPASLCLAVRPSFLAHLLRMFSEVANLTFHGDDPSYDELRQAGTLTGLCCPSNETPTRVESVRFSAPGGPLHSTFVISILHLAVDFAALRHISITLPDLSTYLIEAVERFCERSEAITSLGINFQRPVIVRTVSRALISDGFLRSGIASRPPNFTSLKALDEFSVEIQTWDTLVRPMLVLLNLKFWDLLLAQLGRIPRTIRRLIITVRVRWRGMHKHSGYQAVDALRWEKLGDALERFKTLDSMLIKIVREKCSPEEGLEVLPLLKALIEGRLSNTVLRFTRVQFATFVFAPWDVGGTVEHFV